MTKNSMAFGSLLILLTFLVINCKNDQTHDPAIQEDTGESTFNLRSQIGKDFLMDDQHSYIGFKIKYFGISPVRGRFEKFDGTIFYDPENPDQTSLTVIIDVRSIDTGNETRDKDLLREEDWLNGDQYPLATYQSSKVIIHQDSSWTLEGTLEIKGISKRVELKVDAPESLSRDWAGNEQVAFSATTVINRKDFGIEGSDFWDTVMEKGLTQLSDKVEIELEIHCRRADYQFRFEKEDAADPRKIVLEPFLKKNADEGFSKFDSLFQQDLLPSGAMSTIGNTLNSWGMHKEAMQVFETKLQAFGPQSSIYNQLGTTSLYLDDKSGATSMFRKSLSLDSVNSRAVEYLKIINNL